MSAAAAPGSFALPKTEQGDVDWNALGTTIVDHLLAESFCLNHLDKKFGDSPGAEVVAVSNTDWQFDYEKDGVVVFRKKNKGSKLACFAGRGVVAAPYTVVGDFMTDPESSFLWDSFLSESKYLKTFSKTPNYTDYLGYQRFASNHCFSFLQRDILCFLRREIRNGKFVQSAVSVEDPDYPPQRFITRSDIHLGTGFVIEPFRGNPNTSLVTYFGHVDLKGLPLFITNQVMRMYPLSIRIVRRNFESQQSLQDTRTQSSAPPISHSASSSPAHTPVQQSQTHYYQDDLSLSMFTGKSKWH